MTGFTAEAAASATRADRAVIASAHKTGYRLLHLLTRLGPAVRVPSIGVIVSEASLIRQILLDGEHFSKVGEGASSTLWTPVIGPNGLINMDGPAHAHLRRQLGPMFTPKFLKSLIGDITDPQLAALKERLLAGEEIDLAFEIERTMANVLCRMAGWDISTTDEATVLTQLAAAREMLGLVKLNTKTLNPTQVDEAHAKLAGISAAVRDAYAAQEPGTVAALLREAGLNEDDALSVILALILAGTETSISHVPRVARLAIASEYLPRVARLASANAEVAAEGERSLDALMQEGFRVTVPSPVMMRSVTQQTTVAGKTVKPGDRIVIATHVACQRLGDFNPERPVPPEMRQLWFGAGAHFCIGMPLAMRVTESYLRVLAEVAWAKPLVIRREAIRQKTLAAGFAQFVVACK